MKPWNIVPINDNGEKLIPIPEIFNFINPHPYLKLGAPYSKGKKLWALREGVVSRLIKANKYLKSKKKEYSLILYDSWRPLEVQTYMFHMAFRNECKNRGLKIRIEEMDSYPDIINKIEKFWAYPSFNQKTPPPHSTGGAIDLSIADTEGNLLEMGSDIDEMVDKSKPEFFKDSESEKEFIWNDRRIVLKEVMNKFGFVQHPNEWWHFSYGDQLWAWQNDFKKAIYGRI